ncbi:MAG: EVE domain-containing protein, partial [Desulfonauticus sp.]|nr:EVE domain-containing protein [Desulfonauticus sp.]
PANPRWYLVDVKYVKKFKRTVSLAELKQCEVLEDMQLVRKGNRLSVMPVTEQQWEFINGML